MHRPRHVLRLAALALALLGGLVVSGGTAGAASNGEWAVLPTSEGGVTPRTSFFYDLDPGAKIDDSVTIQNLTQDPITFRLYPADAFNPSTGGIAVAGQEASVTDAGGWITLATNEWTLPAGMQVDVPFTVTVPSDATPGDHAAGISALDLSAQAQDAGSDVQVEVQKAVAVPVFVRVAGPIRSSMTLTDISVAAESPILFVGQRSTRVTATVTNTGNVRLSPEVSATLDATGPGGGSFPSTTVENLLPGASQTVTLELDSSPVAGPATVKVNAVAEGVSIQRSTSFWTVPWLLLLLLVALVVLLWLARRRSRSGPAAPPAATPPREPVAAGS
jgi:hypothetical protein